MSFDGRLANDKALVVRKHCAFSQNLMKGALHENTVNSQG